MIDGATLAQMNGEYVCPPDAGPACLEAKAAGLDMSLIELSLEQSPAERLATHQQFLEFVLEAEEGRNGNATG
jgi:hypothetical protein